jgi:urea transport system permease protein
VLGAIAVAWAQTSLSENFPSGWTYAQGLIFILVVGFFPAGLAGLGALAKRWKPAPATSSATTDIATVATDSGNSPAEGAKAL